jgi:ABC-type uncharacterized transport system permease subunit
MNDTVFVLSLVGAITAGTPLVLAAVGEILDERAGVMNLGVEGMMLVGAVFGVVGTIATGSPWIGLATASAAGATLALVHAALAVSLRVSQIVSGLALVIVGTGLSNYIGKIPDPPLIDRQGVTSFAPLIPEGLRELPLVGPVLFGHDPVVYSSWALVGIASYYLFRTRAGLRLRAVGEDPATADAAGIRVALVRYVHTVLGGALAGLGGGYLTIVLTGIWQDGITAGAGWIAFAIVIFSGWRPWRALVAAYVFGALTNLSFTLQIAGIDIPSDLLAVLPYLITIVVLIVISSTAAGRSLAAPTSLGVPYRREDR